MHRKSRKMIQLTEKQESSYCSKKSSILLQRLVKIQRAKGNGHTVFIRLQAERFLPKSSLSLGKFEAVEGVSAYSRVFLIKKNFLRKLKQ